MRRPDGPGAALPVRLPRPLDQTVRQIAAAGAVSVTPIVLHLRPGAREWYLAWLAEQHPSLVGAYRQLYRSAAYAPKDYQQRISAQVGELAAKYGVGRASPFNARRIRPPADHRSPDHRTPSHRTPSHRTPGQQDTGQQDTGQQDTGQQGTGQRGTGQQGTGQRTPQRPGALASPAAPQLEQLTLL